MHGAWVVKSGQALAGLMRRRAWHVYFTAAHLAAVYGDLRIIDDLLQRMVAWW